MLLDRRQRAATKLPSVEATMRQWLKGTALLLPALAIAGCGGATEITSRDVEAIFRVVDGYRQGIMAQRWSAVAELYTEDGRRMPPNQPAFVGRAAIEESVEAAGHALAFTFTPAETKGYGEIAYSRGSYAITRTPPGVMDPLSDTGKYLAMLEKQEDGAWLITSLIWNSDQALLAR